MISFRDIETQEHVGLYEQKLTNNYEVRPEVAAHIVKQLQKLVGETMSVAELCIGPGYLARQVCGNIPGIRYVGLDFKEPFLQYTAERIPADTPATFLLGDLRDDSWPTELAAANGSQPYDAIISMQSLHDVGGAESTLNIYSRCYGLLRPGGLMLNADLVVPAGNEAEAKPRRITVAHHLQLLTQAGYQQSHCTLDLGEFACCIGFR